MHRGSSKRGLAGIWRKCVESKSYMYFAVVDDVSSVTVIGFVFVFAVEFISYAMSSYLG